MTKCAAVTLCTCSILFCVSLSTLMTYYINAHADPIAIMQTVLANATEADLTEDRLTNFTYVPPYNETVRVKIDNTGIFYNDTLIEEKFIVLKTNLEDKSRGISLRIINQENWIDFVTLALKKRIQNNIHHSRWL